MKFIVDEQLPNALAIYLQSKGYDAVHVNTLRSGLKMPDDLICRRSMLEKRVVISKDDDFLNTYFIKQEPFKVLFVTTGNISNPDLILLFDSNLKILLYELEQNNVVELGRNSISVLK